MRKRKRRRTVRSRKKGNGRSSTRSRVAWENRHHNRRLVYDYLLSHPCVGCGESDILLLEFDHLDRHRKRGTITSLLHLSWAIVKREIDKCQVLCVRCHRYKTAKEMGWNYRIALSNRQKEEKKRER